MTTGLIHMEVIGDFDKIIEKNMPNGNRVRKDYFISP